MKLTKIQRRFILVAIQFQEQGAVIFDTRETEEQFFDWYGFTKDDLEKDLQDLTNKLKKDEYSF